MSDVAATYRAIDVWQDMPEARPRARCRVAAGDPEVLVTVDTAGKVSWPRGARVELDQYDGDQYAGVRAESELRWSSGPVVAGEATARQLADVDDPRDRTHGAEFEAYDRDETDGHEPGTQPVWLG